MKEIAPSLLSANFFDLRHDLEILSKSGIKYLHLDIMDGNFVPNISFGIPVIKAIRNNTDFILDCHLMVQDADRYIDAFKEAGADIVTLHIEAVRHIDRALEQIKDRGMKAGISLNPSTNETELKYIMDKLDLILIMTVNPGFGGQSYIDEMDEKIKNVRKMIDVSKRNIILEVDGGVNTENIKKVSEAGCDLIVAGSAVFKKNKISENISALRKIING